MATIVNERDKILQAASKRLVDVVLPGNIIPKGLKGITLSPSSAFFKFNATETSADPSSITFTLNRKYLTNAASWSVVTGTATLTGSGDTRSLAYSNISSDRVVIRATVTQDSVTYTAESIVTKVKDGLNGTNGTNGAAGTRGTVNLYVLVGSGVSTWSDATANAAILSATGSSTRYAGDMVTIYNNTGFAETKYWNGISAWVTGQIINGNLLVTGTVTSNAIGTNELQAVSIKTTGYVSARGGDVAYSEIPNLRAPIYAYNNLSNNDSIARFGVIGYGNACSGIVGYSNSSLMYDDPVISAPKNAGIVGIGGVGGYFRNYSSGTGTAVKAVVTGNNVTAVRAEAGGTNCYAIDIVGRFRWDGTLINTPPGGTSLFLRADGKWATPSGSGSGVTSFNGRTGAVSLLSSDITALGTLAINITGSAGSASISSNSSALGGYGPNSYLRIVGSAASAGALVGYIIVTDGTSSYKIPGYAV